jgi:hypothetical protein
MNRVLANQRAIRMPMRDSRFSSEVHAIRRPVRVMRLQKETPIHGRAVEPRPAMLGRERRS